MKRLPNMPAISRRRCLQSIAAGAAAATMPVTTYAAAAEKLPWIDAHSHIWTRDVKAYPLAKGKTVDDLAPPSFTAEELLELAHKEQVGRVVLIQHHPYHGWDNSYCLAAANQYPDAFRVVAMVDNFSDAPGRQMRDLLEKKATGFRITPSIYNDQWLAGGMEEMWRTAAQTGQKMCCLINPEQFAEVDAMCQKHPDTGVVIDHFGRVGIDGEIRDAEVDALCKLARHKNTTVKISAYYALGKKKPPYLDLVPMIRRLLDAYGVERLMWASDCPYQLGGDNTYGASIGLIRDRLDFLSDNDRQWLLEKTAEKVFFFV